MTPLQTLNERVDRLLMRHEELKKSYALLELQVQTLTAERDGLKSRLQAARQRIDTLIERLPSSEEVTPPASLEFPKDVL